MTSVPKEMRHAILVAKNFAQKVSPGIGRTPFATGGSPSRSAFDKWFSGSKIVDDAGRPKVMYHGTRSDFKEFGKPAGGNAYGDGYYFTDDPQKASSYATGDDVNRMTLPGNAHPNVMPVHLRITKPLDLTKHGRDAPKMPPHDIANIEASANKLYPGTFKRGELSKAFDRGYPPTHSNVYSWLQQSVPDHTKVIRGAGYDGLLTDYGTVAFHPNQIKSAIGNSGSYDPESPDITKATGGPVSGSDNPPSVFYSALSDGITNAKQQSAPAQDWKAITSKLPGVKQDEIDYSGLHDFLDQQQGQVPKKALLDHMRNNTMPMQEHWFQEKPGTPLHANRPKFTDYTLPGGVNQKELSINLPEKPGGNGPNFVAPAGHRYMRMQQPGGSNFDPADVNRLVHVRMNDRHDEKGRKLLHIEEIQSDWHQKGRDKGYQSEGPQRFYRVRNKKSGNGSGTFNTLEEAQAYHRALPESLRGDTQIMEHLVPKNEHTVPDAPFKDTKDWAGLAMKRVLRHAADNGYHGVTWTTGDQQADRYDLSKHVDHIHYNPGTGRLYAKNGDKLVLSHESVEPEDLPRYIGKEAAEKAIQQAKDNRWADLRGSDLKIGGEGMREFYDKLLPSVANKIGKEFGAKHEMTRIPGQKRNLEIREVKGPLSSIYNLVDNDEVDRNGDETVLERSPVRADVEAAMRRHSGPGEHSVHFLPVTPAMKGKQHRLFKRGGAVSPQVAPALAVVRAVLNRKRAGTSNER